MLLSLEAEGIEIPNFDKPDVYLVTLGEKAESISAELLMRLRSNALSTEFHPDKKTMKAQMKAANRSKARFVILLGDDEIEQDKFNLKNMETGEQELVNFQEMLKIIYQ